ncbi:glycoside hydrolase family 43 protein [Microbacterium gilvum]|uniref:Glycoside hydrolase 43 family protein n=1 Tax=Microbacterium gilvum TaxID=1336204 RepID=A0ABP9A8Q2_9MICO
MSTPRYRNPIIDGDVPDPDAIRVGDRYYLVASSFNRSPGLPVLVSDDLVNWELASHALAGSVPTAWFAQPRHGGGVWAPSIRHHAGHFHVVYPDPDQDVFVVSAIDARGPWSAPRLLLPGLGVIDPCPLWDEDGRTWLVHGWARSRAGRKNVLSIAEVDAGLTRVLGPSRDVIDGAVIEGCTTLEGPKIYRRDGWYWIFAPAGGVATGWQSVFRSPTIHGPYEHRVVLAQGSTPVNGPHQGGWVEGPGGTHWFLHFQDRGVFGRVLHLQPMAWGDDGWPVMGEAVAGGPAQPVVEHPTPFGTAQGSRSLARSDDFAEGRPGGQWAWQANAEADWLADAEHALVIEAGVDAGNLRTLPRVIGQPLPGMASAASVTVALDGPEGSRAGIGVLGLDYLWAGVRRGAAGGRLVVALRHRDDASETVVRDEALGDAVRITLRTSESADIAVSVDTGEGERTVLTGFRASEGQWIGAEYVLFAGTGAGQAARGRFEAFEIALADGGR